MNYQQFIRWEARSRDTIDVKRCYIDVAEDLITGILLSQIVYWHLPDKDGKSKLTVEKDGHLWLAKEREQWWDECRITPKQYDRAMTILESKEFVLTAHYRYNGKKTVHSRILWDNLFVALEELPEFPKGRFRTRESMTSLLGDSESLPLGNSSSSLLGNSGVDQQGTLESPNRELDPIYKEYTETTSRDNDHSFSDFSSEDCLEAELIPEEAIAPIPVENQSTEEAPLLAAEISSGDDRSAAPKNEKTLNSREMIDLSHAKAKYPECRHREIWGLYKLELGHLWAGPDRNDYHHALLTGVKNFKDRIGQPSDMGLVLTYIRNCITKEDDAALLDRFAEGFEQLSSQSLNLTSSLRVTPQTPQFASNSRPNRQEQQVMERNMHNYSVASSAYAAVQQGLAHD